MANYKQVNGIALAYMGDAIYEVYIKAFIRWRDDQPTRLHHRATHYVSAKAQAMLIKKMEEQELVTTEEQEYFRRTGEMRSYTSAENTSVVTYRISTSFWSFVWIYLLSKWSEQRLDMK